MVAATTSPISPSTTPIHAAADRPSTLRTSGLYGWATASAGRSMTSLTTPMQSWIGSIVPTSWMMRTVLGTPRPASPAIATSTSVTSSDGPGWPRKISDRSLPPGRRSSHHTGRAALLLGRFSVGVGRSGLVLSAELMLGVHRGLHRLPRGGQRSVSGRLLGGDLGGEQAIVQGVFEAADRPLGMFRWAVGRFGIGHALTLARLAVASSSGRPKVWSRMC